MTLRIKSSASKRVTCGVRAAPYMLSGIDLLPTHTGIPIIWVYPNGIDVATLEASLIETLKKYPAIAGRIKRNERGFAYVDPCDAGVELRVKDFEGPMPKFGHTEHMDGRIGIFSTPIYPWRVVDRDQPLLRVELSRFEDGGAVLCLTMVHSPCDGTAFFRFVQEWANAARGKAPEGPTDDREVMIRLGQAHQDRPYTKDLVYEPAMLERLALYARFGFQSLTSMRKGVFRIPAAQIESWKQESAKDLAPGEFVGSVDIVAAHFLKTLSPIMRSPGDRRVGMVADLRYKPKLAIPRTFFGNALAHSEVSYTKREVEEESAGKLASKMRKVGEVDDAEDLMSYVAFVERYREKHAVSKLLMRAVAATLGSGLMMNNYRPFPIYEMDFGRGKPSWHDNPRLMYRAFKVVATPESDGGLDIHLTASARELAVVRAAYG
jgi:shikimate O-hydroxycinnamoyltransferase